MSNHLMNTYARLPIAFERGEGAWLWDDTGRRYLDGISGLGVTALGHAHPAVAAAICEQSRLIMHTANLSRIPWQEKLGDRLAHISGLDRAFIANSGSEAIECALKIIRLAGHERGIDNPGVIVMENSFHGRTIAALSATGSRKVQAGFEPLVGGFVRVPFNDVPAIENGDRARFIQPLRQRRHSRRRRLRGARRPPVRSAGWQRGRVPHGAGPTASSGGGPVNSRTATA